ncbi:MAG: response regulator [Reichenbachiella sp.]
MALGQQLLPKQHMFYQLNESDGLTNNVINDIVQDTLGFIWVGTEDGLFKFDGQGFTSFRHVSESPSIPNNNVQSLFVDDQNDVWFMTDFGLGRYSYVTDKFESFHPQYGSQDAYKKSFTSATQGDNGVIYFGTFGGGVVSYSNGQFNSLNYANELQDIDLHSMGVTHLSHVNNQLWICTWNSGIVHIDLNSMITKSLPPQRLCGKEYISSHTIHVDSFGNIWVGTNEGIFVFKLGGLDWLKLDSNTIAGFPDDEILSIQEDNKGRIWAGTRNSGLLEIVVDELLVDVSSIKVVLFPPSLDGLSVSHRTISKVYQDKTGDIWLGTHNSGINIFNPDGENIYTLRKRVNHSNTLSHQSVWGLCEDHAGKLWLGTDGGGVNVFDPSTQKIEFIGSLEGGLRLSDDAILTGCVDVKNNIWLGTYDGGVNVISSDRKKVRKYQGNGLQSNDVRTIYQSKNETIWVGTNRGGLHYFDEVMDDFVLIKNTEGLDIRAICETKGVLWMACFGEGLARYDLSSREVEYFNWHGSQIAYTPIGLSMISLASEIWIGTKQEGIAIFNIQTEKFEFLTESDGLANNSVRALVNDERGNVWASTNTGLSAVQLADKTIMNFEGYPGLKDQQYNDGSGLLSQNGYLVFGGIHSTNLFYPSDLLASGGVPSLTFTELKIWDEHIYPGEEESPMSTSLPIAKELKFNHDQAVFSVAFQALKFQHNKNWNYEYKLEGFDKQWNASENVNRATYRSIPSGSYVLKARIVDVVNGQKGSITEIPVTIFPPWWKTWTAFTFYFLIVTLIVYVLIKYNNRQIALKQTLFYEQKLRQQEHDVMQEKLRFYTNFSHELKTPITLIMGPVNDLLRNKSMDEFQLRSLQLIRRNSKVLLKLINRLLEFRKIETENTVLNVGQYDLHILVQEEAESFTYLAKDRGIVFGFYCETDLHAWIDIEKIQIVLNNILSNALKYSEKGKKVKFGAYQKDNGIVIEVEDEGRGIAKEELGQIGTPFYQATNSIGTGGTGIGLALSKSFVELHGGTLNIESDLNIGTKIIVKIPGSKSFFEGKDHVRFIEANNDSEEELPEIIGIEVANEDENLSSMDKVLLIADDNADIRNYVSSIFKDRFKVLEARDGKDALQMSQEYAPDIVISDVMMPEMDGIEFTKAIKSHTSTSHIPVILLTAKSANETKIKSYESGADGYITKPFDSKLLMTRVDNLLSSRDQLRHIYENGDWAEQNLPSKEMEFVLHFESTVLELLQKGEINVPALCMELGFSRTSLYRKVKSLTGQSISQLIRTIKLKRAAEMLLTEEMSVSEVAFSLSFTDLKYFRNCFKKQFGLLPSQYQNSKNNSVNLDGIESALKPK